MNVETYPSLRGRSRGKAGMVQWGRESAWVRAWLLMNSETLDELLNFSSLSCLLCKMGVKYHLPHKVAGGTK